MKKLFLLFASAGMVLHGALVSTDEVLFRENFDSPDSLKRWQASGTRPEFLPGGAPDGKGNAVRFVRQKDGNSKITLPLDPKKISGLISFEGYIRGSDLSGKADYLGPKFMLTVKDGKKYYYPEPVKGFGSYGWKRVRTFFQIPENCSSLSLTIGIQGGRGMFEVAQIEIRRAREGSDEEAVRDAVRADTSDMPRGPVVPGMRTQFRGVMSGDDLSPEAFAELGSWKVNLIRYQMRPGAKLRKTLTTEEAYLRWIDSEIARIDKEILPLARRYNIKLALDLHYGGRKLTQLLSNELTSDSTNLELLEKTWRKLAAHYRGNEMIYGYDLLNEPKPEDPTKNPWPEMAQRLVEVIREVDPDTPIIVEWFLTLPFPVSGKNLIYSFHFYSPGEYTHNQVSSVHSATNWRYPGVINGLWWDKEQMREKFRPYIEFQKKHGVRMFIGEFSVVAWAPGGAQYLQDCVDLFEEYGWDWTYHAFREWSGWSVEHAGKSRKDNRRVGDTDRKQVLLKAFEKNQK